MTALLELQVLPVLRKIELVKYEKSFRAFLRATRANLDAKNVLEEPLKSFLRYTTGYG